MRNLLTIFLLVFSLLSFGQIVPNDSPFSDIDTTSVDSLKDGFFNVQDTFEINPNKHFVLKSQSELFIVLRYSPVEVNNESFIWKSFYTNIPLDDKVYDIYIDGYHEFINKRKKKLSIKKSMTVETDIKIATIAVGLVLILLAVVFELQRKLSKLRLVVKEEVNRLNRILPNVNGRKGGKSHQQMQLGYWKNCAVNARKTIDRLQNFI